MNDKQLTPEYVHGQLSAIRQSVADGWPKSASLLEFELFNDVLLAIAEGRASDPVAVAKTATLAGEIEFERSF
jgi:hypothetical protein